MRWVVLILALGLAGCAAVPPAPDQKAAILDSETWTLQGRLSVRAGEQSLSGSLRWAHAATTDTLLLTSPLGQGVARIAVTAAGVTLELPDQPVRHAANAESLTRDALGYALPVSGLVWWVRGRADPASPAETRLRDDGRLAQLRQQGWVIDYLQYSDDGLPRKLSATRDGMEIRLVTDNWARE